MPSLKQYRTRIASVKSTQKITRAMKMVAAAKLRRAQSAAESARPYAQHLASVIANLARSVSQSYFDSRLRQDFPMCAPGQLEKLGIDVTALKAAAQERAQA